MKGPSSREHRARRRGVAIPDVERGDPLLGEGLIEGVLIEDLGSGDVHKDGGGLQERQLLRAEQALRLGSERQRSASCSAPSRPCVSEVSGSVIAT